MKINIAILALFLTTLTVNAKPVLDEAVGTEKILIVTVLKDDVDPNLYHTFPKSMSVLKSTSGQMQFAYQEYKRSYKRDRAIVSMVVGADFENAELKLKIGEILRQNPKAKFTPVIVEATSVRQGSIQSPYIKESECQMNGNFMGQEVGCEFEVNPKYKKQFLKKIRKGMVDVLYYSYQFPAKVLGKDTLLTHELPIKVGDLNQGGVFLDGNGNPIPMEKMLVQ